MPLKDRGGLGQPAQMGCSQACAPAHGIFVMTEPTQLATPQVGIFWVVQTADGESRLVAAGCPLDQVEPYGDCLTYSPGHYETWMQ